MSTLFLAGCIPTSIVSLPLSLPLPFLRFLFTLSRLSLSLSCSERRSFPRHFHTDWSGLIYQALGFPPDYFTVLFAIPRVVGWLAHWRQLMLQKNGVKIWRPRQLYIGEGERDYVEIEKREEKPSGDPTKVPSKVSRDRLLRVAEALLMIPSFHRCLIFTRSVSSSLAIRRCEGWDEEQLAKEVYQMMSAGTHKSYLCPRRADALSSESCQT